MLFWGDFLHAGILHILFNMLGLLYFGRVLEPRFGTLCFIGSGRGDWYPHCDLTDPVCITRSCVPARVCRRHRKQPDRVPGFVNDVGETPVDRRRMCCWAVRVSYAKRGRWGDCDERCHQCPLLDDHCRGQGDARRHAQPVWFPRPELGVPMGQRPGRIPRLLERLHHGAPVRDHRRVYLYALWRLSVRGCNMARVYRFLRLRQLPHPEAIVDSLVRIERAVAPCGQAVLRAVPGTFAIATIPCCPVMHGQRRRPFVRSDWGTLGRFTTTALSQRRSAWQVRP